MASTQRGRRKGRQAFAWLIGLLAMALVATLTLRSCDEDSRAEEQGNTQEATDKPIGVKGLNPEDVTVTGAKVPKAIRATKRSDDPFGVNPVEDLTENIEISPSGKLAAPVTLRFKLKRSLKASEIPNVIALTADNQGNPQPLDVKIVNKRYAEVTTDHFSPYSIGLIDVAKGMKSLFDDFSAFATGGFRLDAKPATCAKSQEAAARQEDYRISSSAKNSVRWCFERLQNGTRYLKLTNMKRYPLTVFHKGATATNAGLVPLDSTLLGRMGNTQNRTTVFPGDTIELKLPALKIGGLVRISTEYDGAAEASMKFAMALQVGSAASSGFNGKAKKVVRIADVLKEGYEDLLTVKSCYNAYAANNLHEIIYECSRAGKWLQLKFGVGGLITQKVIEFAQLGGKLGVFALQELDTLLNYGDSKYEIVVQRGKTLKFHNLIIPLQSSWTNKPISSQGEAPDSKNIRTGPCQTDWVGLTWCQGFYVFGPDGGKVGHPQVNYDPRYSWSPYTDVKACPMYADRGRTSYGSSGDPLISESTVKIGNRAVQYREWKIGCSAMDGSDGGNPSKSFVQKVWYDPQSKIFIVDEWNTPGLSQALANATWN